MDDIEVLPPLKVKGKGKPGKFSNADLLEVRLRIPDLLVQIEDKECLSDLHIVLGNWLLYRDFCRDAMPSKEMPCLVLPTVVHTFVHAVLEDVLKDCTNILKGSWKRHGLLGIPINCSNHWTLLVLRRSCTSTKVRYYDSLETIQADCLTAAKNILQVLEPGTQFPIIRNKSMQSDSISCGYYLLHYWEGEVRQYVGEGWSVGRPTDLTIQKLRDRFKSKTKEIQEASGKDLELKNKKKKAEVVEVDAADDAVPYIPCSDKLIEHLAAMAARSQEQGLVQFYGCPKCRWARQGCISWLCNHEKFIAHVEKYPEKYKKGKDVHCNDLKVEVEQKLTTKELIS
jgi:hypothetical protein